MYNKNMNKGKISTIKDMDRINKKRNHCQKKFSEKCRTVKGKFEVKDQSTLAWRRYIYIQDFPETWITLRVVENHTATQILLSPTFSENIEKRGIPSRMNTT